MTNLNEMFNQNTLKLKEIENDIKQIENYLKTKQNEHANAMKEFNKVKIYKDKAKYQKENDLRLFKWVKDERFDTWGNNGAKVDRIYHNYESVNHKFSIRVLHRKDLKVWKYEVEVTGERVHYENYAYVDMYRRGQMRGYSMSYSNFLKEKYGEIKHKFKTLEEADEFVNLWKNQLEQDFLEDIKYDKDMYEQACKRYDNIIRVDLDHQVARAFYDLIKYYPDIHVVGGDYRTVELGGENVKEVVTELNNKYHMNIKVLAG